MWMRALMIVTIAAGVMGGPAPTHARDPDQPMSANPKTLKYIAIPDMPACSSAAIVRGDPRSGPAWVYLKLASGCRVPWHWHTANESLVVVSGQGTLAMKDGPPLHFVPGAYASLPSHHVHQASCSRTCLLFSIADAGFDIHYVNATGEQISLEDALKAPATTRRTKKR